MLEKVKLEILPLFYYLVQGASLESIQNTDCNLLWCFGYDYKAKLSQYDMLKSTPKNRMVFVIN